MDERIAEIVERLGYRTEFSCEEDRSASSDYVFEVSFGIETKDRLRLYGRWHEQGYEGIKDLAEFIAHAPADLRFLLAERQRMKEALVEMRDCPNGMCSHCIDVLLAAIGDES